MPGFGDGPFGEGAFGEFQWARSVMVGLLPTTHLESDLELADGVLVATMETVIPSMDGLRRKIRQFDDLRNPLTVQAEGTVVIPLVILKVSPNDDGTVDVFLGEEDSSIVRDL